MVHFHVDETYANGDGTDSWCITNLPIPLELYATINYVVPICESASCTFAAFKSAFPVPSMLVRNDSPGVLQCSKRDVIPPATCLFACRNNCTF